MADGLRRAARRSRRLTKWRLLRRLDRAAGPPVVVFTMGKVASTAVFRAVSASVEQPVLKVHSLRPARVASMEAGYVRTDRQALPRHLLHAWHLMDRPPTSQAPWTVITMVRDPIQRSVSDFFQSGRRLGRLDDPATAIPRLRRFVERDGVPRTLGWFDEELRPVLDVDVFEHPFDPVVGHLVVETPVVRLLVLRQESLATAPDALGRFLGVPHPVAIPAENAAIAKPYAEQYTAVLNGLQLDAATLELAYDSRFAEHFYSPEERAAFRRRWGGSADQLIP